MLTGPFSDVVDEHDRFRHGGFTTQLGDVWGVRVTEFGALALSAPGQQRAPVDVGGLGAFDGTHFAEELTVDSAEVLARFQGGRTDAMPAVTMRAHGEGRAFYVATIPDDAGLRALVRLGGASDQAGTPAGHGDGPPWRGDVRDRPRGAHRRRDGALSGGQANSSSTASSTSSGTFAAPAAAFWVT